MAKARRAKKSKMPKKLLLMLIILILLALSYLGITSNEKISIFGTLQGEIENYDANDFVKDSFTQGSTKYLPIVYNEPYEHEKTTRQVIENKIKSMGLEIESISSSTIGTGTQIKTKTATFTVIIYGDIDGNGVVNARDVQCIVKHLCYGGSSILTGVNKMAANVYEPNKDEVTVRDAQKIIRFIVGTERIIDNLPLSDVDSDKEAPVITLNGPSDVTIKVGDKYEEKGAEVTDNLSYLDPNIASRLKITGSVNTDKIGDYTLVYSVSDLKGNEAPIKTRIVHVVNYVTEIEVSTELVKQYKDGEKIEIPENIVVYPKMASGGWSVTPVDNTKLTVSPEIARVNPDEKESEIEVTIKYKDLYSEAEYKYMITVKKQEPIITYTYPKDKFKVGTSEVFKPDATALDPETDSALDVSWKIYKVNEDNTETLVESQVIDMTKPGVYKVYYETEKPSFGDPGEATRTVEVLDYIKNITFEIDRAELKTVYVDDTDNDISIKGVKGIAAYAYDTTKREEIPYTELSYTPSKAKYDETNKITVSYTVLDETGGEPTVYSTEIPITVYKKISSIEKVATTPEGVKNKGEIYEEIFIGRVKSGEGEKPISSLEEVEWRITNLDANDTDKDGYTAKAWGVLGDGYVDIYCVGTQDKKAYTVTVSPKNITGTINNSVTLTVTTTANNKVNRVKVGDLKAELKPQEGADERENITRFKAGEKVYADLTFYHRYVNTDGNHDAIITDVRRSTLDNIDVKEVIYNPVNDEILSKPYVNITGKFLSDTGAGENEELTGSAYVTQICLIAGEDATETIEDGQTVHKMKNIGITVNPLKEADETLYPEMKREAIYPKSNYTLNLENNSNNITLSLQDIAQTVENYDVKPVTKNNVTDYYTLIPIKLIDQYRENKEILFSDIITAKDNDKIVIYDKSGNNKIKVIGVTDDGAVVDNINDKEEITYVGVAVAENGEDTLDGGELEIYYKGELVKSLNITILRKAISSIEYVSSNTDGGYCFSTNVIAELTSGARQQALQKEDIKCIVEKAKTDPITGQIIYKPGTNPKEIDWEQISSGINWSTKVKVIGASEEVPGVIAVSFEADYAGKYRITPYYEDSNTRVPIYPMNGDEKDRVIVDVEEDIRINKAIFVDDDGKTKLDEERFGDAAKTVKQSRKIEFYHVYENGVSRLVKNVSPKLIEITNKNTSMMTVSKRSGDQAIKEDETQDFDQTWIDNVLVVVNEDTADLTIPSTLYFEMKIYAENEDGTKTLTKMYDSDSDSALASDSIRVNVKAKPVISNVEVGGISNIPGEDGTSVSTAETIKLYLEEPTEKDEYFEKHVVKEGDIYYTILPISFITNLGNKVNTTELNMNNIQASLSAKTEEGLITFIDNVNESEGAWGDNQVISIEGFIKAKSNKTETSNQEEEKLEVEMVPEGTAVDYVGIALNKDLDVFLENDIPDDLAEELKYKEDWVQLLYITVYFSKTAGNPQVEHRFKIMVPGHNDVGLSAEVIDKTKIYSAGTTLDTIKNNLKVIYRNKEKWTTLKATQYTLTKVSEDSTDVTITAGSNAIIVEYIPNSNEPTIKYTDTIYVKGQ